MIENTFCTMQHTPYNANTIELIDEWIVPIPSILKGRNYLPL